jgi:hypothetical protein
MTQTFLSGTNFIETDGQVSVKESHLFSFSSLTIRGETNDVTLHFLKVLDQVQTDNFK